VKKRIEHRDREVKIRTHTEEELKLLLKMLERRVDERTQELARSRAEAIRMMEEAEALGRKAQQAEERRRKTADELRDLYNNAPCGYHSLNRERGFIAINHTELNWLGYERAEVGDNLILADVLTPDSARRFLSHFP